VTVHCSERGELLHRLWTSLQEIQAQLVKRIEVSLDQSKTQILEFENLVHAASVELLEVKSSHASEIGRMRTSFKSKHSRRVDGLLKLLEKQKEEIDTLKSSSISLIEWFPHFTVYVNSPLRHLLPAMSNAGNKESLSVCSNEDPPSHFLKMDLERILDGNLVHLDFLDTIIEKLDEKEICEKINNDDDSSSSSKEKSEEFSEDSKNEEKDQLDEKKVAIDTNSFGLFQPKITKEEASEKLKEEENDVNRTIDSFADFIEFNQTSEEQHELLLNKIKHLESTLENERSEKQTMKLNFQQKEKDLRDVVDSLEVFICDFSFRFYFL